MRQITKPDKLVRSAIAAAIFAAGLGIYAKCDLPLSLIQQAAAAGTQSSLAVREDATQLKADKAALQRQLKRMDNDEATLKSDTASGRMSAESKDAYAVYQDERAVKGGQQDLSADHAASLQMKSDRAALQRQIKRLEVAEARLKADTKEGKLAAESRDAEKVYKDQQVIKSEKNDVMSDKSTMKSDMRK